MYILDMLGVKALLKNKMKSIRNYLWHSSHSSYMHKLKSEYIMIYPTDTKQYSQACIEFNNTLSLSFSLSFMPHKFYSIVKKPHKLEQSNFDYC